MNKCISSSFSSNSSSASSNALSSAKPSLFKNEVDLQTVKKQFDTVATQLDEVLTTKTTKQLGGSDPHSSPPPSKVVWTGVLAPSVKVLPTSPDVRPKITMKFKRTSPESHSPIDKRSNHDGGSTCIWTISSSPIGSPASRVLFPNAAASPAPQSHFKVLPSGSSSSYLGSVPHSSTPGYAISAVSPSKPADSDTAAAAATVAAAADVSPLDDPEVPLQFHTVANSVTVSTTSPISSPSRRAKTSNTRPHSRHTPDDLTADSKNARCDVHAAGALADADDAVKEDDRFKALAQPRPPLKRLRLIVGNEVINVHIPTESAVNNNNTTARTNTT